MINYLKRRFALSDRGAKDLIKGVLACVLQNISFMLPVSLLYFLISDLMGGGISGDRVWFYVIGIVVSLLLIFFITYIQYNATFLATYVESGVRRITLAEKLRKIPLSFFGKRDLADLTTSIMTALRLKPHSLTLLRRLPGLSSQLRSSLSAFSSSTGRWRLPLSGYSRWHSQ